jgi:hypothetical protein
MTRSERLALERALFELEREVKQVQGDIEEIRRTLYGTGVRRRGRSRARMCVRRYKVLANRTP